MLFNQTSVIAEHAYRGQKLRGQYRAIGSRARLAISVVAISAATLIACADDGTNAVSSAAAPGDAVPAAVVENSGFDPIPAPAWEPNRTALAEALNTPQRQTITNHFNPIPAPAWEPNRTALAEALNTPDQ